MRTASTAFVLLAAMCAALAYASPGGPSASPSSDALVVHEWGTFTVLQDESGKPVGGINTDDEPLPNFVHNLP